MSRASRGGLTLKTGKIGRCNVLRQQLMMPGERMNIRMNGQVRLESLRERDVMRINAHLATFMTPVRWLQSDFPTYINEGHDTAVTLNSVAESDFSKYGVGTGRQDATSTVNMLRWFKDAPLRIYNEWYKWPEDSDATSWDDNGEKAVPLSKIWTRLRANMTPGDSDDRLVASTTNFDVRTLAETQAKFRAALKREDLSFDRYMEMVRNTWKGSDPSREVDQVPIMLDQTEVGVTPRDLPATDGSSLGTWQSLYDFNIDHSIRGIVAPEHCVVTTILVVRFPAITDSVMPLAMVDHNEWPENVADPEWLAAQHPVGVTSDQLFADGLAVALGSAGAGWQWRCDHDVISPQIYRRNSFPYMEPPTISAHCKDATRIKPAFRSQSLGDYIVDVFFKEDCIQPIGTAIESYFSGMLDYTRNIGQTNDEFPYGGKQL
jgi:hypothetical protein